MLNTEICSGQGFHFIQDIELKRFIYRSIPEKRRAFRKLQTDFIIFLSVQLVDWDFLTVFEHL